VLLGAQVAVTGVFAYAFGRRHAKTVNGATTQFLYDGLDMAQQLEPQRTTSYLRSLSIDETLGLTNPDGTFYLTADALGNTVAVSDGAGSAATEYTYDPFGAVTATNPTIANPFQFTGRENDGLAGLYYYRARYYHPGLQRFLSEDPSGFHDREYNLFAYAGENPLTFRDPLGFLRWPGSIQAEARYKAENSKHAPNPRTRRAENDAFKHCLGSCMQTIENGPLGPTLAALLGWFKESAATYAKADVRLHFKPAY